MKLIGNIDSSEGFLQYSKKKKKPKKKTNKQTNKQTKKQTKKNKQVGDDLGNAINLRTKKHIG